MKLIEIRENGSKRVVTINEEPSKTDQSFAKQVNINNIMARYIKTGQLTHLRNQQGVYADMSEIKDLATAVQQVEKAQQGFLALPSNLRNRFENDPIKFIEFIQDPKNLNECYELGIYTKPKQDLMSQQPPEETKPTKTKAKNTNDDD